MLRLTAAMTHSRGVGAALPEAPQKLADDLDSPIWRVLGKGKRRGVPRGRGNPKVGFPRERLVEGAWMTVEAAQGNPHDFPKTRAR